MPESAHGQYFTFNIEDFSDAGKRQMVKGYLDSFSLFGIDFEWRADTVQGQDNHISLIQIAFIDNQLGNICFLIRNRFNSVDLPLFLMKFLRDPKKIKIIASALNSTASDFRKLATSFGMTNLEVNSGFLSLVRETRVI